MGSRADVAVLENVQILARARNRSTIPGTFDLITDMFER